MSTGEEHQSASQDCKGSDDVKVQPIIHTSNKITREIILVKEQESSELINPPTKLDIPEIMADANESPSWSIVDSKEATITKVPLADNSKSEMPLLAPGTEHNLQQSSWKLENGKKKEESTTKVTTGISTTFNTNASRSRDNKARFGKDYRQEERHTFRFYSTNSTQRQATLRTSSGAARDSVNSWTVNDEATLEQHSISKSSTATTTTTTTTATNPANKILETIDQSSASNTPLDSLKLEASSSPSSQPQTTKETMIKNSQQTSTTLEKDTNEKLQRIVLVSGIEGRLSMINEIAKKHQARAIIHTGNFGFYDESSINKIGSNDPKRALEGRASTETASLIDSKHEKQDASKEKGENLLSELSDFIFGKQRFDVPVYVIWGQFEDIRVIENFRRGVYHIPNLYLLDHRNSYAISTEHVTLRLFGLGGSCDYHKLFDIGSGSDIVCGDEKGYVWTSLIQMGELLEMADRYTNPKEVRVFITQASPSKEPLSHILATELRADLTISPNNEAKSICIYEDVAIHTTTSLNNFQRPARDDIKSLWDQVYFACSEKFSEAQRKSGNRFITSLKKQVPRIKDLAHCSHIILPLSQYGKARLCLGESGISVNIDLISNSLFKSPEALEKNTAIAPPVLKKTPVESRPVEDVRYETTPAAPLASTEKSSLPTEDLAEKTLFFEDRNPTIKDESKSEGDVNFRNESSTMNGGSSASTGFAMLARNLPYDITGQELDEQVFLKYNINEIIFKSPRNNMAIITFKSNEELEKALKELHNLRLGGRDVNIGRYDPRFGGRN